MFAFGRVDQIDQRAFVVGLFKRHIKPKRLRFLAAQRLDIGQSRLSIDLGLARAQQVQVRTVQDQNGCHSEDLVVAVW